MRSKRKKRSVFAEKKRNGNVRRNSVRRRSASDAKRRSVSVSNRRKRSVSVASPRPKRARRSGSV